LLLLFASAYCLTFLAYDKVFRAIGIFLLELLQTEYYIYLEALSGQK